jgi:aminoglycoside phosphotransferase (APT) family kinase protein
MWRLQTTRGVWAVKQLNRSRERWWMADYEIAAEVERVAFAHGVAMPRPVHPARPTAPLLADVAVEGDDISFRVHEWSPGDALEGDDVPAGVLEWVGATLAALHALPVTLSVDDAGLYEPHGPDQWQEWLAGGTGKVRTDFIARVRAFLPDIAHAKGLVDQASWQPRDRLTPVFTHRDVKPDNVLLTSATPVLVDWDGAGLDFAEWEVPRAALAFSRCRDGWHRPSFDRVVRTYQALTGRRIPPVAASFAGVLRLQLGAAALLLWRALGHRPATAVERAAAHEHTLEFLTELRASLQQIDHWAHWLDTTSPNTTPP